MTFQWVILLLSFFEISSSLSTQDRIDSVIQANYRAMQNNYENLEFGKQLTFTMNSNKKSTFVFPQCESHTIIDNGIEYSNCILTIVTEFNILNGDITVLTNTGVLIDIKIEKMIYKGSNEIYHLEISEDSQLYMNTNKAFMRSGLFSFIPSILPSIKNSILEQYLKIVNDKYTPNQTINKKDELNAILSLLFMRQPYYDVELFDTEKDTIVNMRESTRVARLTIILEYSVNFNLNYQEDNIHLDNFYFKDKNLTFDSSTFENEDNPQEAEGIRSFLVKAVEKNLFSSKNSYYNIDNKDK